MSCYSFRDVYNIKYTIIISLKSLKLTGSDRGPIFTQSGRSVHCSDLLKHDMDLDEKIFLALSKGFSGLRYCLFPAILHKTG